MFLRVFVFVILHFLMFQSESNAFFTEDYKKKMLYGAFKRRSNADIYLGVRAGFLVKTWTPNVITTISSNSDAMNEYLTQIPNSVYRKTSDNYTYSVGVDIGLHTEGSNFRHEINFEWYGISSDKIGVDGNIMNINGTEYSYQNISGTSLSKIGIYADIYRIGYRINYDFEHAFKMMNTDWDVFVGLGVGMAIVNGGTYVGGEITTDNQYEENDVNFSTDASKYRLIKAFAFAIAYNCNIGVLANISQSFAATVGMSFGATSRPLFTTKFRYIDKQNGMQSHLEYHIAFEIGILLKAHSIAM